MQSGLLIQRNNGCFSSGVDFRCEKPNSASGSCTKPPGAPQSTAVFHKDRHFTLLQRFYISKVWFRVLKLASLPVLISYSECKEKKGWEASERSDISLGRGGREHMPCVLPVVYTLPAPPPPPRTHTHGGGVGSLLWASVAASLGTMTEKQNWKVH